MKDVEGVELKENDIVRTTRTARRGGQYQNLVKARVVGFTPKMVRIQYLSNTGYRLHLKPPTAVIKVGEGKKGYELREEVVPPMVSLTWHIVDTMTQKRVTQYFTNEQVAWDTLKSMNNGN